jgi:hypothetical protein
MNRTISIAPVRKSVFVQDSGWPGLLNLYVAEVAAGN